MKTMVISIADRPIDNNTQGVFGSLLIFSIHRPMAPKILGFTGIANSKD